MKTTLTNVGILLRSKKARMMEKANAFIKDERSAKGTTEEGYLVYAVVTIGILILALSIPFLTDSFTDILNYFDAGVNGQTTNPPGWGK